MKISVVTAAFNAERTIRHTLESFLAQDHADKEMLVIDGGSQDRTVEVVRAFDHPSIRCVSEPDKGLYDAMNKGLRSFSGDAVGFLNADDRFADAGVLCAIAEGLTAAQVVYGDLDFVDSHEAGGRVTRAWRGAPFRSGAFRQGWMPPHPTFYIRREVAQAAGEFDLAYKIAADYDYMLRVLELGGASHRFLPRVMVRMQTGGKSTAGLRGYLHSNLEALQVRRRRLGSGVVDMALIAKPLSKGRQFFGQRIQG